MPSGVTAGSVNVTLPSRVAPLSMIAFVRSTLPSVTSLLSTIASSERNTRSTNAPPMESPGPALRVSNKIVADCVVLTEDGTFALPATRFAASTSIATPTMLLFASPSIALEVSARSPFTSSTSRGKSAPARNGATPVTVRSAVASIARSTATSTTPSVKSALVELALSRNSTRSRHGAVASASPSLRSVNTATSGAPALTESGRTAAADARSGTGSCFSMLTTTAVAVRSTVVSGGRFIDANAPLRPLGKLARFQVVPVDGANDGSKASAKLPPSVPVVAENTGETLDARMFVDAVGASVSAPVIMFDDAPRTSSEPAHASVPPVGANVRVPASTKRSAPAALIVLSP